MWGLDAIALTYVAAHSLQARPLVIPPGRRRASSGTAPRTSKRASSSTATASRRSGKAERAVIRLGEDRSLLATLPEATFVRRYRQSFAS